MDTPPVTHDRSARQAPAHVAPHLVFEVEVGELTDRRMIDDPFGVWEPLAQLPPVFWSTRAPGLTQPGCWVARSAAAIREVMQDSEHFSNDRSRADFNVTLSGVSGLAPLFMDPPEANQYRALLAPLFSAKAVDALEPELRARSAELIDSFAERGACEFMGDYARLFPVTVFLRLMGMPLAERDQFVAWEHQLYQGDTAAERFAALAEVSDYMRALAAEKRRAPADDAVSKLVFAQVDGRLIAPDKLHGVLMLLYMAGLDTVAAGLGHTFRYLADHTDLQARLRAQPELTAAFVEESLRYHSWIPTGRLCVKATDFHDARILPGDWVQTNFFTGSNDAAEVASPRAFDLASEPNRHFGFGAGVHRCAGLHLARRELKVAVEMLTQRLGEFRIEPGAQLRYDGGYVCLGALPLVWDPVLG